MTSGAALNALPPNSDEGTSTQNGGGSDALCSQLTAPFGSQDAARLDIVFELEAGFDGIDMQYLFGSEEYPEYVGQEYNDSVGILKPASMLPSTVRGTPSTSTARSSAAAA